MYVCMYAYSITYTHTSIHPYVHTSTRPYIHAFMHPFIREGMHACMHIHIRTYMMQGCHTPLPPPPAPWYPALPVKWVVVLSGLVAFPVWSCSASSPHPLWSGACGLFGWPRPACWGQCVLQRYGMGCRLLVVMSSLHACGVVV